MNTTNEMIAIVGLVIVGIIGVYLKEIEIASVCVGAIAGYISHTKNTA